jgi:DNA-binding response OmpR family regulator
VYFLGKTLENHQFCSGEPCKFGSIMKILVCEDNKLTFKTLAVVLGREGYQTDVAEDGNVAIDKIDNNFYDLLIIDIHLPFRSGLELVRHLRTKLKKNTPVIILTAFSDPQMQKQAKELGISDYLMKPFNPAEVTKKIGALLNN